MKILLSDIEDASNAESDKQSVTPIDLPRYDVFLCFTHNKQFRSKLFNNLTSHGFTVTSPYFLSDETKRQIDKTGTCIIAILDRENENSSNFISQLQYAFKRQLPILFINNEMNFSPSVEWLTIIMNNSMTPIDFASNDFDESFVQLFETIEHISNGQIPPFQQHIISIHSHDMTRSDRFIGYRTEWTAIFRNPVFKSNQFRQQLNNPTYIHTNQGLHYIFQHYDLNLPSEIKKDLKSNFLQAVEDNDARYLIHAYTGTSGFSRILNEQLATYGLHYFDVDLQDNVNYRLIKCIMDFVAMLYFRPEFDAYIFKGEVYRGMNFAGESELYKYVVKSHIMNTTFLSTSKDKSIAKLFAATATEDKQKNNTNELSVLCTYVILNDRSALSIEKLSVFPDENEVIIMPFSAFRVEKVERNGLSSSQITINLIEREKQDVDDLDQII